jgi:hypothetical protein
MSDDFFKQAIDFSALRSMTGGMSGGNLRSSISGGDINYQLTTFGEQYNSDLDQIIADSASTEKIRTLQQPIDRIKTADSVDKLATLVQQVLVGVQGHLIRFDRNQQILKNNLQQQEQALTQIDVKVQTAFNTVENRLDRLDKSVNTITAQLDNLYIQSRQKKPEVTAVAAEPASGKGGSQGSLSMLPVPTGALTWLLNPAVIAALGVALGLKTIGDYNVQRQQSLGITPSNPLSDINPFNPTHPNLTQKGQEDISEKLKHANKERRDQAYTEMRNGVPPGTPTPPPKQEEQKTPLNSWSSLWGWATGNKPAEQIKSPPASALPSPNPTNIPKAAQPTTKGPMTAGFGVASSLWDWASSGQQSPLDVYNRQRIEEQKSQFMQFGKLPPGFEFLAGHMGRLGSAEAIAASGAMPLGDGLGGAGYSGGAVGRPYGSESGRGAETAFGAPIEPSSGGPQFASAIPANMRGRMAEGFQVPEGHMIDRSQFDQQLSDPAIRNALAARAQIEVGNQPAAQQKWIEATLNRAASRYNGDIIRAVNNSDGYYPQTDNYRFQSLAQQSAVLSRWDKLIETVHKQGTNEARGATGNESAGVQSSGAPILASGDGERYVLENKDRRWKPSTVKIGDPQQSTSPQQSDSVRLFFNENKPYTEQEYRALKAKYGDNISVSGFEHKYDEGRGGPTGDRWAPDERSRIEQAAKSSEQTFDQYRSAEGKWRDDVRARHLAHSQAGGKTYEVDNLQNVNEVIDHLNWMKDSGVTARLLLKNLNEKDIATIQQRFPEYKNYTIGGFNEAGAGDKSKVNAAYQQAGMQTYWADHSTHDYQSSGGRGTGMVYGSQGPAMARPSSAISGNQAAEQVSRLQSPRTQVDTGIDVPRWNQQQSFESSVGSERLFHDRGNVRGLDPKLIQVMKAASRDLPEGFHARIISGHDARATGTTNHPSGIAMDIQIYDDKGNAIPHDRNSAGWRYYEQMYRSVNIRGKQMYPDEKFIWGGPWISAAAGRGDPMHFQRRVPGVGSQGSDYTMEGGLGPNHPFRIEGGQLSPEERARYDQFVTNQINKPAVGTPGPLPSSPGITEQQQPTITPPAFTGIPQQQPAGPTPDQAVATPPPEVQNAPPGEVQVQPTAPTTMPAAPPQPEMTSGLPRPVSAQGPAADYQGGGQQSAPAETGLPSRGGEQQGTTPQSGVTEAGRSSSQLGKPDPNRSPGGANGITGRNGFQHNPYGDSPGGPGSHGTGSYNRCFV